VPHDGSESPISGFDVFNRARMQSVRARQGSGRIVFLRDRTMAWGGSMTIRIARRTLSLTMLASLAATVWHPLLAQPATSSSPSHVVIPFLANMTKPADLDFQGGECELDASGNRMACTFQQVFLTTSAVAPETCLITTNRYQRDFRRDTASRWVSTEGPEGVCGLLDVATLVDEGGVRWTMETHKVVTKKDASPACRAYEPESETLSWQNIRRPLPCKFVQPGGLSR
jgi:hypothetical protein